MIASVVYPWMQKVLPLTYDDSLTYAEMVYKLIGKINEVIDNLTDWSDVIAQLQEAITDIDGMKTDISTLKADIVTINNSLTDLNNAIKSVNDYAKALEGRVSDNEEAISNIIKMIANFNTNVDEKLNALEAKLTKMIESINSDFTEELHMLQLKFNQMKVSTQAQLDELKARVDAIDTSVLNPWHTSLGRVTNQQNTNLSYEDLADYIPTASEYDGLGLTADEYDDAEITAMDYARKGKKLLHFDWVYSPTGGFLQEISNVLTGIVGFLCNTMSSDEYDALDLTADEYDALDLTAQNYYTYHAT